MKKKLLALVLVVALAVTSVIGGTLAYQTDKVANRNVMTLGQVSIVQNEQKRDAEGKLVDFGEESPALKPAYYTEESIPFAEDSTKWPVPNNEAWKVVADNSNVVDKFVTVTNDGTMDAYVRTIIAYEGDAINGTDIHIVQNAKDSSAEEVNSQFAATDYIENVTINDMRYDVIVYTYAEPLQPKQTTIPSLKQIYMDKGCDNWDVAAYGETYDVLVLSQAIQTDMWIDGDEPNAAKSLNEGFGEPTKENIAKWFAGVVANPYAKVTELDGDDVRMNGDGDAAVLSENLKINTTGHYGWGVQLGELNLDAAYQFQPPEIKDEAIAEYADWHADFVVSADKDVPAYSVGLAGYYDAWCSGNDDAWVMLTSPEKVTAGTEIRLVGSMGRTVSYEEIFAYGSDGIGFLCGVKDLSEVEGVKAVLSEVQPVPAGTTLTVELRLYEATGGRLDDEIIDPETGEKNYILVSKHQYTFK